jgi:hypothetical protein
MDHTPSRQIDYLALQVERIADAFETLADRVREIERWRAENEAVVRYKTKEQESRWRIKEIAWRAVWGTGITFAVWLIQEAARHLKDLKVDVK